MDTNAAFLFAAVGFIDHATIELRAFGFKVWLHDGTHAPAEHVSNDWQAILIFTPQVLLVSHVHFVVLEKHPVCPAVHSSWHTFTVLGPLIALSVELPKA